LSGRVLVTGASGFIGRHALTRLASRGYEIHAVSHSTSGAGPNVAWHTTDLLEPGAAERLVRAVRPSHLLHLAWLATPGEFWSSPQNHHWVEASGTLIQEFAAAGGKRVVVAGTCAEYDWASGLCIEGETSLEPATLYGRCKHVLHERTEELTRETGVDAAWGRIFFLYGPYEHPARLVASVIRSLLRGEEARSTHGEQVRDFLHVADVADAFATLVDSEVVGAVNIGSGSPTRIRDLVELIATATGRRELLRIGALPAPPDEAPVVVADVRRLNMELGWVPDLSLEEGVRQTVEWWRGEGRLDDGHRSGRVPSLGHGGD
jgi:nucleoside-diphosphate-sugar epimerase